MVRPDPLFEEFLHAFQIRTGAVDVCRICLLDDRYTPITNDNFVIFGKSEKICLECGRRELRRELAPIGHMGKETLRHFEELLDATRNLDRVLALVQPEKLSMKSALFDRIEAHPVLATAKLEELPLPHEFVVASRIESLMPVQQLAVDAGLLFGKDLLVVAATASGKTFIGEMAGMKNYLAGRGRMLFLVPLVALANQKYERFTERVQRVCKDRSFDRRLAS